MGFPSNATLIKIAAYGAVAGVTSILYMRSKIEDRIRNAEYFKSALEILQQHKGAVKLLGEPIREIGFDLGDEKNNFCDGKNAKFEISVRGPKDKGTMYFWASRSDDIGWKVDRLDLEVKSHPDKKFLIKKAEDTK